MKVVSKHEKKKQCLLAEYEAGTLPVSQFEMRHCGYSKCDVVFPVIRCVHSPRRKFCSKRCVDRKWQDENPEKYKRSKEKSKRPKEQKKPIILQPSFDRTQCFQGAECTHYKDCIMTMAMNGLRGFECPHGFTLKLKAIDYKEAGLRC